MTVDEIVCTRIPVNKRVCVKKHTKCAMWALGLADLCEKTYKMCDVGAGFGGFV